MPPTDLNPGDLVRYAVTNTRWHLAVLRSVDGTSVELEFFWGSVATVPLERVLSLERTAFCEAFFGDPLLRLRGERFRAIETVLRQHGIAFDPKQWPTPDTRIQLWRDTSVVLNNAPDKDSKLASLLPRWL